MEPAANTPSQPKKVDILPLWRSYDFLRLYNEISRAFSLGDTPQLFSEHLNVAKIIGVCLSNEINLIGLNEYNVRGIAPGLCCIQFSNLIVLHRAFRSKIGLNSNLIGGVVIDNQIIGRTASRSN